MFYLYTRARWGHKKNMIICPKHPRHSDWLASQGNTSNTPLSAQNITQQSYRQDQPRAETEDIIEVNTGGASTGLYDSDDPDFQLEQYIPRIETTATGFRRHIEARDPSELPASKQAKVRQLLRQYEGEDNSIIQESIPEYTSYQTRGQSNYTLFLEKRKQAEREWGTVEACYFMYKYKRNIWRAQ
jgi:hypothetical protein